MTTTRTTDGPVATITLDDGKVNALDAGVFAAIDAALDESADDGAVVIAGRPGVLSAGLNTRIMADMGTDELSDLLVAFGRTMLRLWCEPRPVVVAATGHAVAGGTILAMAADHAVAADGEFAWGLTETTIGFPLPGWIIALARANVAAHHVERLLLPGRIVDPPGAVEVGFADEVVAPDEVLAVAAQRAADLAQLPARAYTETKRRLRAPTAEATLADLVEDTRRAMAAR